MKLAIYTAPELHFIKAGTIVLGAILIVLVDVILLNRIIFALTFIPGVKKIVTFSWTQFLPRYIFPKFNPLKK